VAGKKGTFMPKISLVLIALIIFIGSCIDPLDIDIDREVNILIVEGSITTLPGPYFVRLSLSAKFGSVLTGAIRPVNRATVLVRDSDGNNYNLSEQIFTFYDPDDRHTHSNLTGVYATDPGFLPEVGKSYSLIIKTSDGTEYTSLPEKIIKVPEILALEAEFKKIPLGSDKFKTGLEIFTTFQDPLEEKNFYMWKNTGTYKIFAFPENHVIEIDGEIAIPDPKECCKVCWVTESIADLSIRLLTDNNVNGNRVTKSVAFIEDDGFRYTDKYLVRIEQHRLSREAFQFFELLDEQLSINGDIFDPPPATIRGNMINLTNPNENVIGYFRASDVSIDSIFLTPEMLLEPAILIPFNDDCREYRGGTTVQPAYW
jgi:uncharacterized protein DUF4249